MAILINSRTGRDIRVDASAADFAMPAVLPSHPVEDGFPVVDQRSALPAVGYVDVLLTDVPGDAGAREDVYDWIDEAANRADDLQLVVPGFPTFRGLRIGTRGLTASRLTTSTRLTVELVTVRTVRPTVGQAVFPTPRADLQSGQAQESDGGEQAPKDPRRSLAKDLIEVFAP